MIDFHIRSWLRWNAPCARSCNQTVLMGTWKTPKKLPVFKPYQTDISVTVLMDILDQDRIRNMCT